MKPAKPRQTNLEFAREVIAKMRRNGHAMTNREAEQHARRVARLLDATPDLQN